MKKALAIMFTLILTLGVFVGCSEKELKKNQEKFIEEAENKPLDEENKAPDKTLTKELNIGVLNGPTGMGMVKVMEDTENNLIDNPYNFSINTTDEIVPKIITGELDFATVPANLASILYKNTQGNIQVLGINTLGVLYMLENGNDIKSIEDLRGKTIYATGKGTTPEYVLNYILSQNGISVNEDVIVEYKSEATEILSLLSQDNQAIAMLPQPFVTTAISKLTNLRIALDLTSEWDLIRKDGSALITGVIVSNKEFIDNYPEETRQFLSEYKLSTEYINANPSEASLLVEKFGISPANIAEKAIPLSNIVYIDSEEMKEKLQAYLFILHEQNPESVGGQLPNEDFYRTLVE